MTPADQAQRIIDDWNNGIPHQYSEVIDVVLALANQIAEHQRVNEVHKALMDAVGRIEHRQ